MNEARIIADSIGPTGHRLTTMLLRYPRMVHADFLRHRCFSYSVGGSRAVPSKKLRAMVRETPATIAWWGKQQAGMTAAAQLDGQALQVVQALWAEAREHALTYAEAMDEHGLQKQLSNRVLEPFADIIQLTTGVDWDNFEALRCHPDAQPEIRVIAEMARAARAASTPRQLRAGEWHLPFITEEEIEKQRCIDRTGLALAKISAARCARTSYLNHEGKVEYAKDLELYERLVGALPGHWSPLEHVCQALAPLSRRERLGLNLGAFLMGGERGHRLRDHGERFLLGSGNLVGWRQLRKFYPTENVGGIRP